MLIKDQFGISGKVALVLGGGQGMGEATAARFAAAGCNLALVDLDVSKVETVAARMRSEGVKAIALVGDMRDPVESQRVVDETVQHLGTPDFLVSIIGQASMKPILDVTAEELDREWSINFRYFFFAAQAFARTVIAAGKPGAIVSLSSISGVFASPIHAAYGATKAAMMSFVKSCAVEWADHSIRVNAVAPGSIITPRVPDSDRRRQVMHESMVPMRRSGTPEEIAGAILFLCSDLASYVTGQTLMVDGGYSAANIFNGARDASSVVPDTGAKF
jgi:3-oxoacyl-[acyl-carrier protein] reductase